MDSFCKNQNKSKNGCFLAIFGLILAMFLTFQSNDFDAFVHAGAPSGVEWLCKTLPSGAHYYLCFNLSLIIESNLEYQYTPVQSLFSAQWITVQVYGEFTNNIRANNLKTKESFK